MFYLRTETENFFIAENYKKEGAPVSEAPRG